MVHDDSVIPRRVNVKKIERVALKSLTDRK